MTILILTNVFLVVTTKQSVKLVAVFTNCEPHFHRVFNRLRQQYHFGSTLEELLISTNVVDIIGFVKGTNFYNCI